MTTLDSPLPKHKLLTKNGTMGQALIFCINKTTCMYEICYSSKNPVNDSIQFNYGTDFEYFRLT